MAAILRYLVLAAVLLLGVVGGAGMTRPSEMGWAAVILAAMGLWAGWLYWRAVLGDRDVPGHLLHPFSAAAAAVLLGHLLLSGGGQDGAAAPLGSTDSDVLMRLMTLSLLVLLAQDVLGRAAHMRWLPTGLGAFVAVGAILRLYTSPAPPGAAAVTLGGLAGVGMLLTPLWMPDCPSQRLLPFLSDHWRRHGAAVRVAGAAALAALLVVRHPGCAVGAVLGACAAGAALLLAGAIHGGRRGRLLTAGAVLAACGGAGVYRLGMSAPPWCGGLRIWGEGVVPVAPDAPGVWTLGAAAGWAGVGLLAGGIVTALARSLWAGRSSSPGDRGRSALWAVVVLTAGCALLAPGGLTTPSVTVIAAIALGLMPHMMVHRVRRYHGLVVVAAFAVALAVMGLQQMLCPTAWSILAVRWGDGPMHLFGTFVLAGVLLWQLARGRLAVAAGCAVLAATAASIGEIAQRVLSTRTPEWSDVMWDCIGAASALAVYGVIHAAAWLESLLPRRQRVSKAGYEIWRHVAAGGAFSQAPPPPQPATPPPGARGQSRPRFARSDRPRGSDQQSRRPRRR